LFLCLLLIAYIAQGGEILVSALEKIVGWQESIPDYLGAIAFTLIFGGIMYFGRNRFIEQVNSALGIS
jgi:tyrosine-specific transport protein